MNHIYQIVFNRSQQCYQAVAETATSQGKTKASKLATSGHVENKPNAAANLAKPMLVKPIAFSVLLAFSAQLFSGLALAEPTGGQVTAGAGTINQAGAVTTINQATQNMAIDWHTFNVRANEAVNFNQPNANAIALNRITGTESSSIMGSLTANGKVFILNPNGVLFGAGAQVNVGGLVASTLSLSNANFMAGNFNFNGNGNNASIVNNANINIAEGGTLAFIAPVIKNNGTIIVNQSVASQGSVILAAADDVTLTLQNGGLTSYTLNKGNVQTLIDNGGLIQADGGHVVLTAKGLDALSQSAINHTGIIEAQTVSSINGKIELLGDMQIGTIFVAGKMDASGKNANEKGGAVIVTANKVALLAGTSVDVSGMSGGGKALIGGDYLGGKATDATMQSLGIEREQKSIPNATFVNMAKEAVINANAIEQGDGGKVVVWSDNTTRAYGNISATGGATAGDGGFVEVSGKNSLDINGLKFDLSAINGKTGSVLFDPTDIHVVTNANATPASFNLTNFIASTSTNISSDDIEALLNQGISVSLLAGSSSNANYGEGNIYIEDNIFKVSGGDATLSLSANSSVFIKQALGSNAQASIKSIKGKLKVVIDSDIDNKLGGLVEIGLAGKDNYAISTNGGDVRIKGWDILLEGKAVQSVGGNILVQGIDDTATWITIGSNNVNDYTLDALTGTVSVMPNLNLNLLSDPSGDFVELHNRAIRAKNIEIKTTELRNKSDGYQYSNSEYSYSLPAYDNDDAIPELAYVNLQFNGVQGAKVLDGQIIDSALTTERTLTDAQNAILQANRACAANANCIVREYFNQNQLGETLFFNGKQYYLPDNWESLSDNDLIKLVNDIQKQIQTNVDVYPEAKIDILRWNEHLEINEVNKFFGSPKLALDTLINITTETLDFASATFAPANAASYNGFTGKLIKLSTDVKFMMAFNVQMAAYDNDTSEMLLAIINGNIDMSMLPNEKKLKALSIFTSTFKNLLENGDMGTQAVFEVTSAILQITSVVATKAPLALKILINSTSAWIDAGIKGVEIAKATDKIVVDKQYEIRERYNKQVELIKRKAYLDFIQSVRAGSDNATTIGTTIGNF